MNSSSAFADVQILSYLTLFGNITIALLLLSYLVSRMTRKKVVPLTTILKTIESNGLVLAFIVASTSTLGSLFFSEVEKFVPCKLCWYQRIAMYPEALILGIALFKNDLTVRKYVLALSAIGFLIALYHVVLQNYPGVLPCSDEIANCALKQFTYFGYITIPVMSATAFALVFLLAFLQKSKRS